MSSPDQRRFADALRALTVVAPFLFVIPARATPQAAGPGTPRWALDLSASGLSDVDLRGEAFADENVVPLFDYEIDQVQILTPQAFAVNPLIGGTSYGAALYVDALQQRFIPAIGMTAYSSALARPMLLVYGVDTDTITIVWVNASHTRARVDDAPLDPVDQWAKTNTPFSLDCYVTDVAFGTPLRYHTQYWLYTDIESYHETDGLVLDPLEDPAYVQQANLFIDGTNLTADRFDLDALGGDLRATREYLSPIIVEHTTAGTRKLIEVTGETYAESRTLSVPFPLLHRDWSHARFVGIVRIKFDFGVGSAPDALIEQEDPSLVTYSLDIGSDAELSGMPFSGNEAWDPGDVYVFGAPNPAPGINGPWNDLDLTSVGFDYVPAAPFGATPPVPVCGGPPPGGVLPPLFLDLDGHHLLDVDLTALLPPLGAAPAQSIARTFASDALFDAWHLAVSFDDDGAPSSMACDVPNNTTGSSGATYGRTAARDETIAIDVDMFSVPAAVLATSPLWDEGAFSVDLLPNPDHSDAEDDDVDSLSLAALDPTSCPWLYFSVDHEAPGGPDPFAATSWDPDTIYMAQSSPGCGVVLPVPVLDPLVNLGLAAGTDIDAFELAWVWDAAQNRDGLALLFSVDEDDPGTADDESGALDPNMIYVSFLTGTSQPFLDLPLEGDVDAIGVWRTRLTSPPQVNPWIAFCDASDGSLSACPCGNAGAPDAGCDNAQGTGGVKATVLAQTTSPNGATLQGSGFSSAGSPTAIVLRSPALDPLRPVVFGDGVRCIGTTSLVRLAATVASGGSSTHTFGHGMAAGPGTFFYQVWYRNTPSAYCDPFAAFNLSNGAQIVWW